MIGAIDRGQRIENRQRKREKKQKERKTKYKNKPLLNHLQFYLN